MIRNKQLHYAGHFSRLHFNSFLSCLLQNDSNRGSLLVRLGLLLPPINNILGDASGTNLSFQNELRIVLVAQTP